MLRKLKDWKKTRQLGSKHQRLDGVEPGALQLPSSHCFKDERFWRKVESSESLCRGRPGGGGGDTWSFGVKSLVFSKETPMPHSRSRRLNLRQRLSCPRRSMRHPQTPSDTPQLRFPRSGCCLALWCELLTWPLQAVSELLARQVCLNFHSRDAVSQVLDLSGPRHLL